MSEYISREAAIAKLLRDCCRDCKLWDGNECCLDGDCTGKVRLQAADAIEELSKLADAIPHVCECCVGCELEKKNGGCDNAFVLSPKRAMQYLIKPRWIPVTERLPEDSKRVLIHSGDYVGCGLYTGAFWKDEDHDYVIVTHWMPLPEPPEEKT